MLTDIIEGSNKYIKRSLQALVLTTALLSNYGCGEIKEISKPTLNVKTEQNIEIKENPNSNKYAILVHGFKGSTDSLSTIERFIPRFGYNVHNFNYPSAEMDLSSHRMNLEMRIKTIVDLVKKQGKDPEIHLFGHSTGGRIIVDTLHHIEPKYRSEVEKVILMSPCLGGSEMSDFGQLVKEKLGNVPGFMAKRAKELIISQFGEKTYHQLSPSSEYMKYTLENVTFHPENDYLIVGGYLMNNPFDKLFGELNDEVIRVSNQSPYTIRGFDDNPNNKLVFLENVSHLKIAHDPKTLDMIHLYLVNKLNLEQIKVMYSSKKRKFGTIIGIRRDDISDIDGYTHFTHPEITINNEQLVKQSFEKMFQDEVRHIQKNGTQYIDFEIESKECPRGKFKVYVSNVNKYLFLSTSQDIIMEYEKKLIK